MSDINFGNIAQAEAESVAYAALKNALGVLSDEEQALLARGLAYLPENRLRTIFTQASVPEAQRHGLALRALLPPGETIMSAGGSLFLMAYSGWSNGVTAALMRIGQSYKQLSDLVGRISKALPSSGSVVFNFASAAKQLGRSWVWDLAGAELTTQAGVEAAGVGVAPIQSAQPSAGHGTDALDQELPR